MNNLKSRIKARLSKMSASNATNHLPIHNVGVVISHTHRQVRIRDLDRVYQDILIQGDEMQKFQDELRHATRMMPNVPIGDALFIVTAPFVAGRWS